MPTKLSILKRARKRLKNWGKGASHEIINNKHYYCLTGSLAPVKGKFEHFYLRQQLCDEMWVHVKNMPKFLGNGLYNLPHWNDRLATHQDVLELIDHFIKIYEDKQ